MASTELQITETFHRHKRTLLIFSTAALALSLSSVAAAPSFSATLVSVTIDNVTLWWMLWLAALYYAYGFFLEARVAWRDNCDFTRSAARGRIDEALDAIVDRLKASTERASSLDTQLQILIQNLGLRSPKALKEIMDASLQPLLEAVTIAAGEDLRTKPAPTEIFTPEERVMDHFRTAADRTRDSVEDHLGSLLPSAEEARSNTKELLGICEKVSADVSDTKRRLGRLFPQIAAERRQALLIFELAAPFLFLTTTTLVGIPELIAGGARMIQPQAQIASWIAEIECAATTRQTVCNASAAPLTVLPNNESP